MRCNKHLWKDRTHKDTNEDYKECLKCHVTRWEDEEIVRFYDSKTGHAYLHKLKR